MKTAPRVWIFFAALVAVVVGVAWANDRVSLEGERTVYTVQCSGGSWESAHCTGELVVAERFRFRALRAHREVLFWSAGSAGPSGKFADCVIQDGRNWSCKSNADSSRTITQGMEHGHPTLGKEGINRTFHSVPKWKWHLVRMRLWGGQDADN